MDQTSKSFYRAVTPQEFVDWLKTHQHLTWSHQYLEDRDRANDLPGWPGPAKYIQPMIDTRDMMIFTVKAYSGGRKWTASERITGEGTMLDLLEKLITTTEGEPDED